MSDVTRRLSRWKAKYSPEIAAQTTARIYADMTERYQASMVALCTMETETKQVLDASGIDTMYIVFYLDYARQLFRLSHGRTISGPTLAKEAQVLLEKWQNRGGDTSATRSSRRSVDVSPSASPRRHSHQRLQRPRADAVMEERYPLGQGPQAVSSPSPPPSHACHTQRASSICYCVVRTTS
jgi:hypothetical protein